MAFEEAVNLVVGIENMSLWVHETGHLLVGHRERRVSGFEHGNGPVTERHLDSVRVRD